MWSELVYHSTARVASAALSFTLFALIARHCSTEDAKAIYFYAFALGFLVVTVRTYGAIAATLNGQWRTALKLRVVLGVTGELLLVQASALPLGLALFSLHPIPSAFIIATPFVVALAGFDSDLFRASLNKRSSFSLLFAAGGAIGLLIFALAPAKTRAVGCGALLAQWVPVVCVNAYLYVRLFWRRGRIRRALTLVRVPATIGALLVVAFDGIVLNAPFFLATRIEPVAGIDLSIATRIFVSSLPLAPLVMHWSNNGSLALMSDRLRLKEPTLYSGLIGASGAVGGAVLIAVYALVSGKPVTWTQYVCSLCLLGAYAFYAGRVRFAAGLRSGRVTVLALSCLLILFLVVFLAVATFMAPGAVMYVAWEASTLLAAGAFLGSRYVKRAFAF